MIEIFWYISLVAVFGAAIGSFILLRAIKKAVGSFRSDITILFIAGMFAVLSCFLTSTFAILEINVGNLIWISVPVLFSLATGFFVYSMVNLNRTIESITIKYEEGKIKYEHL